MTHARGGFANVLAPGFRKIIFETYRERPTEGTKLVNMGTSMRAYEEDFPIAGFGTLQTKPEGSQVKYQDAVQGTVKRYTWTTYALGFRTTLEMFEDDLYGIFGNKMSKALGRSARNNFEIVAHAPYNNAFSTSFVGFEAGVSLVSATHTTVRGATISNTGGAVDFDIIALQAGLEHFHALTDESGIPAVFIPRWVLHSIGDYWLVNQVLKSQYLPGGNQNDINQVSQEGLSGVLSHYLTDPDAWFVICGEHDVNYFDRRKPQFTSTDDFQTGDALFKVMRRNGSGFGDFRGIYGASGA